ncbi:hypothetical protein RJT34_20673 [Clitoria ternatea]|uniref:Uncharacterized protein n=1 Tax=Clitoria ternatea TaxID=43366 RepID=A0AAN9P543_CLITE
MRMRCCFLSCFATSKPPKQFHSAAQTHVAETALEPAVILTQQKSVVEELIDCIAESKTKNEERAQVTFTKEEQGKGSREEEAPHRGDKEDDDVYNRLFQEESSESLFSLSIECSGKHVSADAEVNGPMQLACSSREAFGFDPNEVENLSQEKPAKVENTTILEEQPGCIAIRKEEEGSSAKKPLMKENEEKMKATQLNQPVNKYRYADWSDESDLGVTFEDGTDVKRTWVPEESSESLFSLSPESRKRISSAENTENEVNSLMATHVKEEIQGRILEVSSSSVLNPIENLTQGRVVKATVLKQPLKNEKENIKLKVLQDVDIPISPEPSLKPSNRKTRRRINDNGQEIGVDTSLSSWLVESETTPISKNSSTNSVGEGKGSPFSHEDRPILGALTVEDIKTYSLSTSSRRSKTRSPDETPIIGVVGSYWSHTGKSKSLDSKFNTSGKDGKLKWSSTTLKTRLEPAFEATVAHGSQKA